MLNNILHNMFDNIKLKFFLTFKIYVLHVLITNVSFNIYLILYLQSLKYF